MAALLRSGMLKSPPSIIFQSRKLASTVVRSQRVDVIANPATATATFVATITTSTIASSASSSASFTASSPSRSHSTSAEESIASSPYIGREHDRESIRVSPQTQPRAPAGRRPPRQPGMAYFPLGYKDAVQQWVSPSDPLLQPADFAC